MFSMMRNLFNDEAGVILSAELVIILTIAVLGMVVGLSCLQTALLAEFTDLGMAFRSLNQSYCTPSFRGCWKWWGRGPTSWVAGSCFFDRSFGCVGITAYGNNGCEILGSGNYYTAPTTTSGACPTNSCVTDTCPQSSTTTNGDIVLPSPSPTPIEPVPDANSR